MWKEFCVQEPERHSKKWFRFDWSTDSTNRCLNVRSATANRKKNRNVRQNRRAKPMVRTNFSHVWSPNANFMTVTHENDAFSNRITGISRMFISDEFVELKAAWNSSWFDLLDFAEIFESVLIPHKVDRMQEPMTAKCWTVDQCKRNHRFRAWLQRYRWWKTKCLALTFQPFSFPFDAIWCN